MKEFKDKVAVITGAANGIGKAIAERCVKEGMKVVLADINEKDLGKSEAELRSLGGTVLSVRTDVSKRNDMELLARKTLEAFGEVHLLFNNAGVSVAGTTWDATLRDWEWVIGVNLWGVIHGVNIFTPIMLNQNSDCHIVNTASVAGLLVGDILATYSVTKHAVVALSEGLYLALDERGARVKASVLCPGFVRTNLTNAEQNRPVELQNESNEVSAQAQARMDFMNTGIDGGIPSHEVADKVFEAIREEKFYILTHPEMLPGVKNRLDNILRMENPQHPHLIIEE